MVPAGFDEGDEAWRHRRNWRSPRATRTSSTCATRWRQRVVVGIGIRANDSGNLLIQRSVDVEQRASDVEQRDLRRTAITDDDRVQWHHAAVARNIAGDPEAEHAEVSATRPSASTAVAGRRPSSGRVEVQVERILGPQQSSLIACRHGIQQARGCGQ
jgi:hypothetical protein